MNLHRPSPGSGQYWVEGAEFIFNKNICRSSPGWICGQTKTFVREKIFRQFTSLLSHLCVIVRPSTIIMIRFITNTTLITITEYSVYHFSSPPSKAIEKLLLGKLPEATSVRLLSSRHSFCRMKIPL